MDSPLPKDLSKKVYKHQFDSDIFIYCVYVAGCEHPKTCGETKHGCCPDGVSMAIGPYLKGCKMSDCAEKLYGCCKDNVTAATGNDFAGCEDDLPCDKTK